MAKERHCWFLLILQSFLILSLFVGGIHGSTQVQALRNLQKSMFRGLNSELDKSLFDSKMDKGLFDAEEIAPDAHHRVYSQEGLKEKDRIVRLPGQPPVRFSQYGGYVTVDKIAGRAFYYYFVEAQHSDKDSLPLLLWLNGGPGCSSLAYGAMQELGPFRVHSDGKTLFKIRYPWNYAANVLFLESPAGVGFSYSNSSSDYDKNGDRRTAADNYVFLLNWLERFPEYKNRDFYVSGESYAGHYVPQLAHTILFHNTKANRTIINLKGIMIGNAVINEETDTRGMYDYFGSHALISEEAAYAIDNFCDFSANANNQTKECNAAIDEVDKDIEFLDIYNIYAPLCKNSNLTASPKKDSLVLDPCSEYYVIAYLNREDVQEALHANVTKLKFKWAPCSDVITIWGDSPSTIIPLLQEFLNNGLRVWIFSGDIDGRVPVTSTQQSIKKMKLEVTTPWHPWFLNGEVGGYTKVYQGNLTFATVRDAGHQVPSYQQARAFSLIKHFLDGTPLPDTTRY